jgi:hypothetical protein
MIGPPAPFPARPPAPKRWLIALIGAGCGLLVGALGGAALGATFVHQAEVRRDFEVVVNFQQQATQEQQAAIRAAVDRVAPGDVESRTAQENYERWKTENADRPELVNTIRPDAFMGSLVYYVRAVQPDCGPIK